MNVAARNELLAEARASGAFDALPWRQRQAFLLWCSGSGYKTVGVMLGVPRDTARGRVERAVANLKQAART